MQFHHLLMDSNIRPASTDLPFVLKRLVNLFASKISINGSPSSTCKSMETFSACKSPHDRCAIFNLTSKILFCVLFDNVLTSTPPIKLNEMKCRSRYSVSNRISLVRFLLHFCGPQVIIKMKMYPIIT